MQLKKSNRYTCVQSISSLQTATFAWLFVSLVFGVQANELFVLNFCNLNHLCVCEYACDGSLSLLLDPYCYSHNFHPHLYIYIFIISI